MLFHDQFGVFAKLLKPVILSTTVPGLIFADLMLGKVEVLLTLLVLLSAIRSANSFIQGASRRATSRGAELCANFFQDLLVRHILPGTACNSARKCEEIRVSD